ncbi:MAG TPA: arylsulfatase [Rhodoferax sp.]|nr:arylsulfatase [Rhodoferax sp.]
MSRFPFALLLLSIFGSAVPAGAAEPRRPNIVVIVADDWGFSDVGSFGSEIATPNLDALARSGMRFSNFHVAAECSPTRAMLMTGVDSHRTGVGAMRESVPRSHYGKPGYLTVLNQNVVTVSSLLQEGGYRTYAVGKWHVGKEPYNLPNARGFDRSLVQGDSGSDNWETDKRYMALTDKVYWFENGKEVAMPKDYYSSEYYVSRTIDYLRQDVASNKPFYAYLAFQANHIPVQAPREFIDKYRGVYKDGWTALRKARRDRAAALGLVPRDAPMVTMPTTTDWDALSPEQKQYEVRRMEVYAGMADAMDHHVGRLVAYLKESGQYDNTVFVFLSDNGSEASDPYAITSARLWLATEYTNDLEKLGDKGAYGTIGPSWASASASPLSTYKFYSGEGGVRTPLIVSGVPGMRSDAVYPKFAHVKDIAPTLLDLAGVQHPGTQYKGQSVEAMTGRSLMPVLKSTDVRAHPVDEPVGYELSGNMAVYRGDLKLTRNMAPVGDGQWHLYDIVKDPGETQDLQSSQPDAFQRMRADYDAYAQANGVLPMPEGYEPRNQVLINSLVNVYLPRARIPAAVALVVLVGLVVYRRRRHRVQP